MTFTRIYSTSEEAQGNFSLGDSFFSGSGLTLREVELSAKGGPFGGPLTKQSNSSARKSHRDCFRESAHDLRKRARSLNHSVRPTIGSCGFISHYSDKGSPDARLGKKSGIARVLRTAEGVRLDGVKRCANPWACPVCAPKLAAARALALKPQVDYYMSLGYSAYLVTLTLSHGIGDDLSAMFSALSSAWKKVTSGRAWDIIRKIGLIEFVRGLDITFGKNGWHPHIHCLILIPPSHGDGESVLKQILDRWISALDSLGFKAKRSALDYRRVDNPAEAAAYAVRQSAVYEAGAMALKRANGKGAGITPFEILTKALDGDSRMISLWKDYLIGTKGKRQTTVSRGLTLTPDEELISEVEEDPSDETSVSTRSEEPEVVVNLDEASIRKLDGKPMARMLSAFETSDACGFCFLESHLGPEGFSSGWWRPPSGVSVV